MHLVLCIRGIAIYESFEGTLHLFGLGLLYLFNVRVALNS